MKSIKNFLIDELEKENRTLKRRMSKNRKSLKNPIPVAFTAELRLEEPGNDVTLFRFKASTVEEALEKVIGEFKKSDNANWDGGMRYEVIAHLSNGNSLELPKKYWADIQRDKEKK